MIVVCALLKPTVIISRLLIVFAGFAALRLLLRDYASVTVLPAKAGAVMSV